MGGCFWEIGVEMVRKKKRGVMGGGFMGEEGYMGNFLFFGLLGFLHVCLHNIWNLQIVL